jgi:spore germination cell wall hydrolase CwlJ-like protein
MFTQISLSLLLFAIPSLTNQQSFANDMYKPLVVQHKQQAKQFNKLQLKCLAENIYFEARSEKDSGKKAIALVTLNRLKKNDYNHTICGIVYQKTKDNCQFSWVCSKNKIIDDKNSYIKCEKIAKQVMTNYHNMYDITKGATSFHRKDISPRWVKKHRKTVTIGKHIFYKI